MKNEIKTLLFDKNHNISSIKLRNLLKNNQFFIQKIYQKTKFLNTDSIVERIYCIYNDINELQKCYIKNCENEVSFINFNKGYHKYCSTKCAYKDEGIIKKRKETNLKKYGTETPNSFGSKSFKENLLKKYGDENYNNRQKSKETCLKNYGTEHPLQNDSIKEKRNKNNLKKYGIENPNSFGSKSFKENLLKKYGVENVSKLSEIKKKVKKTKKENCLKRYGVESYSQSHIKNFNNLNKEFIITNFIDFNGFLKIDEMQEFYNISVSFIHYILRNFKINYKSKRSSKFENEIYDFLTSFLDSNEIIKNDRTLIYPLELDFYLPNYDLAIEFNGLYYHSHSKLQDKNYHLNKTKLCETKGVKLFHIFENEWIDKKEIWKSMIRNSIKKTEKIFYARKCKIKEIDNKEYKEFTERNHLQGFVNASIKIGLFYNEKLVSVMSFGKSRFKKQYDWELLRFCNERNCLVIGGASKLLKWFLKNYNGFIISYANRKFSNGNLYEKLGFMEKGSTPPNYFYFKKNLILSRMNCQKHKLLKLLDNFDKNKSEYENMIDNGYEIMYDSGNKIYEKII